MGFKLVCTAVFILVRSWCLIGTMRVIRRGSSQLFWTVAVFVQRVHPFHCLFNGIPLVLSLSLRTSYLFSHLKAFIKEPAWYLGKVAYGFVTGAVVLERTGIEALSRPT